MRVRARTIRSTTATTGSLLVLTLLAGCSGAAGPQGPGSAGGGVLTIGMPNGPQANNSNPLLDTSASASLGYRAMIYEPLAVTNSVRPEQDPKPWLAESWEWNADHTEVALTIRSGPTWSDGETFDAADVAFTFEMLMGNDALNMYSLPFEDVAREGDTVTLSFGSPQYVNEFRILDTYIVPEHIWSQVEDPAAFENQEPVGTGPFVLESFTQQAVTLTRRDSYWQDLPAVEELRYTSYNDNNAQTTALANGDCDWSWVFIPNYEQVYVERDAEHNDLWFPTGLSIDALWVNNEVEPFDDPELRRAMSMVIDRAAISEQAEAGLFPALTSPTGLPMPAGETFLSAEYADAGLSVDVEGAQQVLRDAGYQLDGDTLRTPEGDPVTLTLTDPAGWSDYLTALSIIDDNLAAIGIDAKVETQTADAWTNAVNEGEFEATLHWTNGGATPYDMYQHIMDGTLYQPVGEAAPGGNFARFRNDEADRALRDYAEATDEAVRAEALDTLQRVMAEEVPVIPTVARPAGAEYRIESWTGWPDADDPYANPQPTQRGALDIVLQLEPAA
ncbi:ABC transporter substrate-binding protein [Streptomyces sp. B6B3]|uniref:ABC transporter substrate-binding protein n=1 Tax=Streptomyces sp. B6B3 TaxID=3153570 RepID=UPI00325DA4FD